jgi:hypothetical protein
MFYAKNLTWSHATGTDTVLRGYDLDVGATKCVQHINSTNGNHTWVKYVDPDVYFGESTERSFRSSLDLVWVNPKASNDTVKMR